MPRADADEKSMSWLDRKPTADTEADAQRLEQLCSLVTIGVKQFQRVGLALKEIRETELYRRESRTFDEFCQRRWKMTERHAERLIAAAVICRELGELSQQITTENQARQLSPLSPAERVAVVTESTATGESIARVSRKFRPTGRKKIKQIRFRLPGGTIIIEPNKRFQSVEAIISELTKALQQKNAA